LQAAEVRQKGLRKQLAEEKRKLASKEKEAGGLAQELQREQRQVDECSAR
jgi:structural maintenance of chromosome 2